MTKVAINGFGRIGRLAFRALLAKENIEVVAINDLTDTKTLAHLLKYDSTQGKFDGTVEAAADGIIVNGTKIGITAEREPKNLPWGTLGVDVVLESTGRFVDEAGASGHLEAGAKKVVISAPAKGNIPTVVLGVNEEILTGEETIMSNASCTTNCLAPLAKIIHDKFGIAEGLMTTVHAATATQSTVDGVSKKDYRLGRASLNNIVPASTGAAKAVGKVIPSLNGILTGMAFRIPTVDVSVVDLTCRLERPAPWAEVKAALKEASEGELAGILGYTEEGVVSQDFVSEPKTSTFDANASMALNDGFVKLVSWYDNEFGYSTKLIDLAQHIGSL